jgi:hypothetical protein
MIGAIREMLERSPFVPFQVVMSSGDRISIENADLAVLDDVVLTYCLPRSNSEVRLGVFQIAFLQIDIP